MFAQFEKHGVTPGTKAASVLNRRFPRHLSSRRATSGAAARHGPHHSAEKSMSIGTGNSRTISSNTPVSAAICSATAGSERNHLASGVEEGLAPGVTLSCMRYLVGLRVLAARQVLLPMSWDPRNPPGGNSSVAREPSYPRFPEEYSP